MGKRERIREKGDRHRSRGHRRDSRRDRRAVGVGDVRDCRVAFLLSIAVCSKKYWLCSVLFAFALVLALAPPSHAGLEAAQRGAEILTGTGILVVGRAIVHALGIWLSERYPDPELACFLDALAMQGHGWDSRAFAVPANGRLRVRRRDD
jgi:hypothetical protein